MALRDRYWPLAAVDRGYLLQVFMVPDWPVIITGMRALLNFRLVVFIF